MSAGKKKSLNQKLIDILENVLDRDILNELLKDKTSGSNIIWATNDYLSYGEEYSFDSPIIAEQITGENGTIIKPRVEKDLQIQLLRSKGKAEVFTPSWVCNIQNNMIDDAWFGKHTNRFNKELHTTWESTYARKRQEDMRDRIKFSKGKTWKDYVMANRLEISCGEAPYLTSRYDTVTGKYIKPRNRIGLLDRKLRIITENATNPADWLCWAEKALQSTYGFEWQGDNVLLARENMLLAVIEYYEQVFNCTPEKQWLIRFSNIISWNLWQMDGIKFVIPNSCLEYQGGCEQMILGGVVQKPETKLCPGCLSNETFRHNGIYAKIMDWEKKEPIRFVDITREGKQ